MRVVMLLHKSVEFDSRVRREASALATAGHDVVVLELAPVSSDEQALDGFRRQSVLPSPTVRRILPFHFYRAVFLLGFVGAVVRLRPQVVHAHDAAMLVPGALGAWLCGAQLVYDSHELATGVPYRERGWATLVAAIERMIVPRCTSVITVSDGIAERLRERYRLSRTPAVVRNVSALEVEGEGGLRAALGLVADAQLVLHQGAPSPGRGCEVLVKAVSGLGEVNLAFLGDPEPGYGAELTEVIAKMGLGDRVSLLPSVPLTELLAHTAEADVGVSLLQNSCENHRLALPNKLFEYIAAEVPVVASALPEMRRLIDSLGVGWCVAPDDPTAVAEALRNALGEARGDEGLHERLREASTQLRWTVEQERLLELYRALADAAR